MTTPGGSSGFEYGPDSVAARLSVDVPPEGIQTLHQLAKETENLRTQMEALVRAEGDHIGMVQQMSEIHAQVANSTRGLTEEMSRLSTANNMGSAGQGLGGGIYPTGTFMDPFGQANGVGMARDMAGNDPRGFMNQVAQHGGDTKAVIDQASMQELSQIIQEGLQQGMQDELRDMGHGGGAGGPRGGGHSGGGGGPGGHGRNPGGHDDDSHSPDPERDRLSQIQGITNSFQQMGSQFANELGPGGQGMGGAMMNVLRMGGGGGSGMLGSLMGAAGRVGPAGAALGIGLAANQLMQMGGEKIQGYDNMGMTRGGGVGEGMGQEYAARSLAMNPFISTEQARQVIQGALSSGAQGKSFDKVTDFLSHNLTEMNMTVNESMDLLKSNVHASGEGIESLNASLSGLKENSKTGAKTFDDLKSQFEEFSKTISQAGGGTGTNALSGTLSNLFPDNETLRDSGANQKLGNAFLGSTQSTAFNALRMQNPGLANMKPIQAMQAIVAQDPGKTSDQILSVLTQNGKDADSIMWQAQALGIQLTEQEAIQYAKEAQKGPGAGAAANAKRLEPATKVVENGAQKSIMGNLADFGKSAGNLAVGFAKGVIGDAKGSDESFTAANRAAQRMDYDSGRYSNPVLDQLVDQYGAQGIEIVDKQRNVQKLSGDKSQIEALTKGDLLWRQKGDNGAGKTLQQGISSSPANDKNEVNGQIAITVSAPGLNVQAPKSIPISSNSQKAYQAYGSSTLNNAPPGE